MRRIIALLLIVGMLFSLAGCVTQHDLDAVTTERDALRNERDALQIKLDTYSDVIDAMEAENYEAAMDIISQKQIAKETAELGDFHSNVVTVELTAENIGEYFEFLPYEIEYLDAFGNGTGLYDCGIALSSKVFDSGLVYWESENVAIEILFAESYGKITSDLMNQYWSVYSMGSYAWGWDEGHTVLDYPLGAVVYGFNSPSVETPDPLPDFHSELLSFGNAQGTITFIKAEYVDHISNEGCRTVFLKDGQSRMTGYWCNGVDWPDNILG